jgi:hypothetical protein
MQLADSLDALVDHAHRAGNIGWIYLLTDRSSISTSFCTLGETIPWRHLLIPFSRMCQVLCLSAESAIPHRSIGRLCLSSGY